MSTAPAASMPSGLPAAPTITTLRLGYLGLMPFAVGAALVWIVDERAHPYVVLALAAYAALIASFLGALHWGIGMVRPAVAPQAFVWAVMPCLIAWPAVIMPPDAGLVVLGVLLAVCYVVDRRTYPGYGLSGWLTLRFRLSAGAAFCCFLGAAGA
jgi:Protein of unknown function (DUF3429)